MPLELGDSPIEQWKSGDKEKERSGSAPPPTPDTSSLSLGDGGPAEAGSPLPPSPVTPPETPPDSLALETGALETGALETGALETGTPAPPSDSPTTAEQVDTRPSPSGPSIPASSPPEDATPGGLSAPLPKKPPIPDINPEQRQSAPPEGLAASLDAPPEIPEYSPPPGEGAAPEGLAAPLDAPPEVPDYAPPTEGGRKPEGLAAPLDAPPDLPDYRPPPDGGPKPEGLAAPLAEPPEVPEYVPPRDGGPKPEGLAAPLERAPELPAGVAPVEAPQARTTSKAAAKTADRPLAEALLQVDDEERAARGKTAPRGLSLDDRAGSSDSVRGLDDSSSPPPPPSADAPPPPPPSSPQPPGGGGGSGRGGPPPPPGGGDGGRGNGKDEGQKGPPVRIGDLLVEKGLISKDQLQVALQEKRRSPLMMGELLVSLGFITEQALAAVLAESSGHERFDLKATMVDPELLRILPKEAAQRYHVFPVSLDPETKELRLAMADIYDIMAMDQVKRYFPPETVIKPLVCIESDVNNAIDQYYGHELSIDGILREIESSEEDIEAGLDEQGTYSHPLVRLVNAILMDAVKVKASDLHFEPEGNFLRLRYRIDGVMTQVRTIHKQHWPAISHRIKIVSGMNIADKLNPQDGRFTLSLGNHKVDFRVSSLPTVHGENIVMRILDSSSALVSIGELGFSKHNFDLITKMVKRPEGIIIVTGPTGSGKTTTLYSIMSYINSLQLNIMTLEDPVEYEMSLIRQSQIREGTNMTFAEGIRAMLRQDPDVVLVGEVRDSDTATMALRAAMTGHQVYSTLHTNDAAGAIPRLMDMGMRPSLMAGNIIGILAQRLARKLCSDCKEMKPANEEECRLLGVEPDAPPVIGHPVGCDKCRGSGYRGRIAIAEILVFSPEIDEMVIRDAPLTHIRETGRKYGFVPMAEDGIQKVLDGTISIPSLVRCVDLTSRM